MYTSSDACWFLVHVMIVTHMHGVCKPKINLKVSWGIWCLIFHADSCNDCVHNLHAWPKCTNVSSDFFAFWANMWVSHQFYFFTMWWSLSCVCIDSACTTFENMHDSNFAHSVVNETLYVCHYLSAQACGWVLVTCIILWLGMQAY